MALVLKRLRRRGNGLKSHPTDWDNQESNLRPLVYKTWVYPLHHGGFSVTMSVVCGRVPWWLYQYWPGGFVVLYPGAPEGSTGSGSGFKASQKTDQRLKVSSERLGEAGNRTCDPWGQFHQRVYDVFCLKNIVRSSYVKNRVSSNY